MRKTARRQAERELAALRDRLRLAEGKGVVISRHAYDLEQRLQRQLEADAAARSRLAEFLRGQA